MEAAVAGREEENPMSRPMLRVLAVLALATLTVTGAAHASGRSLSEPAGLSAAWEWLGGWLREAPGLSAMWGEEGGQMDPNGGVPPNAGSQMDPSMSTDEGGIMDPNG
jgi:hypothetical protein